MINKIKSNKIISLLLIIVCIIILINPTIYAKSCLNAISVWSANVLPLLFPFFVITRLIVNFSSPKRNFMDKFFCKTFNVPQGSFLTFFLSTLSGYPMGAKLICNLHQNNTINNKQAEKMLSFCSVSGPMFMLGSVGIMMLKSYKAGLIILISNVLASLLNGLIYRGKNEKIIAKDSFVSSNKQTSLADCVYDALISILMVGAYIVLSFLFVEILKSLNILNILSHAICCVCRTNNYHNVVLSILSGTIEITGGILDLSTCSISLGLKTIIASALIGFGGLSVLLQSLNFLTHLKIPVRNIFKQKVTQALLCLSLSSILCLIFF